MPILRLDKFLTAVGAGSRSEVKNYIKAGKVSVDGNIVKKADTKVDTALNEVSLNGKALKYVEYVYYMLNKPQGVVSATTDNLSVTVIDLIKHNKHLDLFPVGRLDKDTEGLLLITNDGELAHNLLSPKKHINKKYYVELDGVVTKEKAELLSEGINLEDEFTTLPATVEFTGDDRKVFITIQEGKFHQVKRMFKAVGLNVTYLKRISMGSLELDKELPIGKYRELTIDELKNLKVNKMILDNFDAIIFDLDGTLVDSMWLWKDIDIEYLSRFGIAYNEKLQSEIEGKSFTETAIYFKENFGITDTIEKIKNDWNEMAYLKYKEQVSLKTGALEFLKLLKEKEKKLGIATSNSTQLTEVCLNSLNINSLFDVVITGSDIKTGKPAPDIYLENAKRLKVLPERCLVFEDIPVGIMAGKNAGMKTCAVADEYSKDLIDEKLELSDYSIIDYKDFINKYIN